MLPRDTELISILGKLTVPRAVVGCLEEVDLIVVVGVAISVSRLAVARQVCVVPTAHSDAVA